MGFLLFVFIALLLFASWHEARARDRETNFHAQNPQNNNNNEKTKQKKGILFLSFSDIHVLGGLVILSGNKKRDEPRTRLDLTIHVLLKIVNIINNDGSYKGERMNGPVGCHSTSSTTSQRGERDITLMDKSYPAQGHVRVHTDGFTPFTGPKGRHASRRLTHTTKCVEEGGEIVFFTWLNAAQSVITLCVTNVREIHSSRTSSKLIRFKIMFTSTRSVCHEETQNAGYLFILNYSTGRGRRLRENKYKAAIF